MNSTAGDKVPSIWNKVYTCAFIANFMQCLAMFMVNPLIANYSKLLGASEVMIGLLSGLYFGVAFAARPFSGPAIAMLNKKRILLSTYTLGIIVNIGYAIGGGIPFFMGARLMHGFQFAFMGSLNMTLASGSLPQEKMGSGLGLFGVGGATANAIAPSIGLALRAWGAQAFGSLKMGYTVVFLAAAACMLVALLPCSLMPYTKPPREEIAKLGLWYKNIFAFEALMPACVVMLTSVANAGYTIYMERYAEVLGISNIGLFFTVNAIVLISSRPFSGRLVDKYGPERVFVPCVLLFALSFVIVGLSHTLPMILLGAAVAAVGVGGSQPTVQTMCLLSVDRSRYSVASNTNFFGADSGGFVGPIFAGLVISRFGFQNSVVLPGGAALSFSPLYMTMIVPLLLSVVVFTLGLGVYRRNAAKARESE